MGKAALLCVASSLAIMSAAPSAAAQSPATVSAQRQVALPAQPLQDAVLAVAEAFDVNVVAPRRLVAGKRAPAVSGPMTAAQALAGVLEGSGLVANRAANGGFLIAESAGGAGQTAPAGQGEDGGDGARRIQDAVVVRGTKQDLTVQETDVSVEMFSAERIDRESIFTLDDLVLQTSNVTLGGNGDTINIRGIARSGVGDAGQGVTSNVYLDGAPVSTESLFFGFDALWDVAQVEVLRGPQSTVQGRNALAGAIVITTKDPTYHWEAAARARYESFNGQQYAVAASGPLVDDQMAFRLSVDHQKTDGFVDNAVTGEDQDFSENVLVRGKLLIEPDAAPGLRAELTADYNDSKLGAPRSSIYFPMAATDPAFQEYDVSERLSYSEPFDSDAETLRLIGDVAYDLNDHVTLRGVGTYEDAATSQIRGDFDDLNQFPLAGDSTGQTDTYSGEVRAEFDYGRWSGIVGGYYFEDDFDSDLTIAVPLATQIFFPIDPADAVVFANYETGSSTRNYAIYGQARFELSPKWTLDFGVRYDNERYETPGSISAVPVVTPEDCLATVPGAYVGAAAPEVDVSCGALMALFVPASDGTPQSAEFDAVLPRGAVTYHASEDLSVFLSAQRGYRAGGTYLRQTSSGVEVGTFDPEFLTNVEAGFRSRWLDGRLTLNGNVFHSWLSDQQVVVPGPSGLFFDSETVNAGESTIFGAELRADYQATDTLNVYGSLGLLDAEFEDFPYAAPAGAPFDNLKGNGFPQAAPVSFNLGGRYEHASGMFVDANVNHVGSSDSGIANLDEDDLGGGVTEVVDARTTVNMRLGYRYENVRITGYVTNLFDDDTQTRRNFATVNTDGGGVVIDSNASVDLQEPRVIGIQLDVEF